MDRIVYVNMERVTATAISETTGWPYAPSEKVTALMGKMPTWWDWRRHRLAYGAQAGYADPTQLQWARPITGDYDPTV